ncbi:hypothetical protein NQZ68_001561 [Dissostichus eleginoides]|nr:hypothetical protein NQZ68_001561 [Dissostichus eleginoides]
MWNYVHLLGKDLFVSPWAGMGAPLEEWRAQPMEDAKNIRTAISLLEAWWFGGWRVSQQCIAPVHPRVVQSSCPIKQAASPGPLPQASNTVTGGVTLSDPNTVCESAAEGSSCQGGLVGERPKRQLCQAKGPGGAPVAAGKGGAASCGAAGWRAPASPHTLIIRTKATQAVCGPLNTNTTLPSCASATHLVYHLYHSPQCDR